MANFPSSVGHLAISTLDEFIKDRGLSLPPKWSETNDIMTWAEFNVNCVLGQSARKLVGMHDGDTVEPEAREEMRKALRPVAENVVEALNVREDDRPALIDDVLRSFPDRLFDMAFEKAKRYSRV